MTDVLSKKKRSQVMAAIHSSGNKETELKLAMIFRANGIKGWRRQQPILGKPDFIFHRLKVAVFVDGCFWHGCRAHCRMPKTRIQFWETKIDANRKRDRKVNRMLKRKGWKVVRFWEHALRNPAKVADTLHAKLASKLKQD
jgi:DNA mismatch endonuclease (patch repair protein)